MEMQDRGCLPKSFFLVKKGNGRMKSFNVMRESTAFYGPKMSQKQKYRPTSFLSTSPLGWLNFSLAFNPAAQEYKGKQKTIPLHPATFEAQIREYHKVMFLVTKTPR